MSSPLVVVILQCKALNSLIETPVVFQVLVVVCEFGVSVVLYVVFLHAVLGSAI